MLLNYSLRYLLEDIQINKSPTRGDIFYADLRSAIGSEQGGVRPVLVIQNDIGNMHSPTVIVAAVSSKFKKKLPTHVDIDSEDLEMKSIVLLEQIRTIDKTRLKEYVCTLSSEEMKDVDKKIAISFAI